MGQVPRPRPERLAEKLREIRLQLGLTQEEWPEGWKIYLHRHSPAMFPRVRMGDESHLFSIYWR